MIRPLINKGRGKHGTANFTKTGETENFYE